MNILDYDTVFKKAQTYGQEHLLNFYHELSDQEQKDLLEQVNALDFDKISRLYQNANQVEETKQIAPMPAIDAASIDKSEVLFQQITGVNAMKNGEYAAVTMAGGQGTRLAFDGPKGMYDIGLESHKTLFEIQLDVLKKVSYKAAKTIPWYIMTSIDNHDAIAKFFEENNYFDYPKEDIILFKQSALPMIGEDGKILLASKGKIKMGSDGNGAIFHSMRDTGVFDDMKKRGIKWFCTCNIDNVLVKCADPAFLGFSIIHKAQCVSKSLIKNSPTEPVGVFCYKDGKPGVVEYSELSSDMAEKVDDKGEFVYGDSHISATMFSIEIAQKEYAMNLPYHTAHKKAAYIDASGNKVVPEKANAYKFEAFIFDAFAVFDRFYVYRVKREDEFAPVKNKEGNDSPQTAKELYMDYQKRMNN